MGAEAAAEELGALATTRRARSQELLGWLRLEFGVEHAGRGLECFVDRTAEAFIAEVRRGRGKGAIRLSPKDVAALTAAFSEYAPSLRQIDAAVARVERRLADLINEAYGLTPAEVELLWRTAPPRMPIQPPAPGS